MRSPLKSIQKQGVPQQIGAAARRGPQRHEFGMQLVQGVLQTCQCCRSPGDEHGSCARLGRLERGNTAAMEQASIVETGHDGHERIESRAIFRHPVSARRAERRQAEAERVREGCLRLATGAGRAKSQADLLAIAQRAGCKAVR